jgi:hypothetical protein
MFSFIPHFVLGVLLFVGLFLITAISIFLDPAVPVQTVFVKQLKASD